MKGLWTGEGTRGAEEAGGGSQDPRGQRVDAGGPDVPGCKGKVPAVSLRSPSGASGGEGEA